VFPPLPVPCVRSGLIGLVLACSPALRAFPEQSVSTSRQFIVYGTEVAVRGAICDLAERTKRDLLVLLAQRDSWSTPIVINAQYPHASLPEAPRGGLIISQTGFGLKLQVDLTIDLELSHPKIRRELLRAVLVEMMYRGENNPPAGTFTASPPDWLLDGVPARQSDLSAADLKVLAVPVFRHAVLPLAQFLQQNPEVLDAPGRSLYRAYSLVLVNLLTGVPGGPGRLARFVRDLPSTANDPATELRLHFPELFESEAQAEKRWKDRIARLSLPQHHQLLDGLETERILNQMLHFKISEAGVVKTLELAEFPKFLKHPSARTVLPALARELNALAARANPIYRPLLVEYGKVTAALLRGKTKGMADRLAALRASRRAMIARVRAIDDYLNWFEATGLRNPSGAFLDYMKAAESVGRPARLKHDPISVYLDALEAQFED
jgi:hypothetical protein